LERFNREIGRRTDVVGIFPDDASVIRLVSMLAIEANDEWLVGRSYISRGSIYDAAEDGRIACVRLGGPDGPLRFERAVIEALIRDSRLGDHNRQ
jgi:hypothetical protein